MASQQEERCVSGSPMKQIIARDVSDDFEAYKMANAMAGLGLRVVSITHDSIRDVWFVFGECDPGYDANLVDAAYDNDPA